MEVYIEYVILDNLIMDYILLKETAILLKRKFNKLRLTLGAVIGVVGAVVFPLLNIKVEFLFLLKILLGALICFTAVNHRKIFDFLKFYNVFILLTFFLGGAVIGTFYLMGISLDDYGKKASSILPIGVSVLTGYLLVLLVKAILKNTVNTFMTDKYRYKCLIKCGFSTVKVDGYFDSGNLLLDKKTGLPVALCKKFIIDKLNKFEKNCNLVGEMDYSTVGGFGKLELYSVDCMMIEVDGKSKIVNCLLGLAEDNLMKEDLLFGAYLL